MTLNVPLTVRVGNRHITREVSGLTIRKEAVGGVRSIQFRLFRPLDQFDPNLATLSKAYVYDGRSARTVAEGRLTDPGRSVGSDGQTWEATAKGPASHTGDITAPYVVIDQSLSEGWLQANRSSPGWTTTVSSKPGDTASNPTQGILATVTDGTPINNSHGGYRYWPIQVAGQKLARYSCSWVTGFTDGAAIWQVQCATTTEGGSAELSATAAPNVAGGTISAVTPTNFPDGRNLLDLRLAWTGGAATAASDIAWVWFSNVVIRAMLRTKAGADITAAASYTTDYVLAHDVVADLLGRWLIEYDGANATINSTGTFQFKQLVYSDGVTSAKVLEDLMAAEPAFYWTTGPSTATGKYAFYWQPWPTTVRYEVTLNGGANFPSSGTELYNGVWVRYRDASGQTRSVPRTMACSILDAQGLVQIAQIDLGDEVGTLAYAQEAGDNFLLEHNVPKNGGTVTIDRPIRDLHTGRMVQPWEIEPAHLIRVRGVESYPDALNASSNDGETVFRIWTSTYTSESNSASLELDSDSLTQTNALAALMSARTRKR